MFWEIAKYIMHTVVSWGILSLSSLSLSQFRNIDNAKLLIHVPLLSNHLQCEFCIDSSFLYEWIAQLGSVLKVGDEQELPGVDGLGIQLSIHEYLSCLITNFV